MGFARSLSLIETRRECVEGHVVGLMAAPADRPRDEETAQDMIRGHDRNFGGGSTLQKTSIAVFYAFDS